MKAPVSVLSISVLIIIYQPVLAKPINICPENPYYYFFKNSQVVLITSAEHFGCFRQVEVRKEFKEARKIVGQFLSRQHKSVLPVKIHQVSKSLSPLFRVP